jgi:hypothetical protein
MPVTKQPVHGKVLDPISLSGGILAYAPAQPTPGTLARISRSQWH